MTNTKTALEMIADCFTAEEAREAAMFATETEEFAEFVETEVQYDQSIEDFTEAIMNTRRQAE
jgi:hypothetical protein